VNLGFIPEMRRMFDRPVGLSDHSIGIYTALASVALGACAIEKHFTLDRTLPGPDQKASIEPGELRELVQGARAVREALGAEKRVWPDEEPVKAMARESVVSLVDIPAGATITDGMVWVKRPGTGIPAKELPSVIGKRATRAIPRDSLVPRDALEG
jgi:sialic acid synthase SpsE